MTVRVDTPSALDIPLDGPAEPEAVKARGYWELVFIRFRRDKLAVISFGFIVFLFASAFAGAPLAAHLLGHGPTTQFGYGLKDFVPVGPWSHIVERAGFQIRTRVGQDAGD